MSQLPLSLTTAQGSAGSRSTSGSRALLLVLLGLFAGRDIPGIYILGYIYRYIYIYVYSPRREGGVPGTQLLQPRVWWAETKDSTAQFAWDSHSMGQALSAHTVQGSRCVQALKLSVQQAEKARCLKIRFTKLNRKLPLQPRTEGEVKPTSDNELSFSG